MARISGLQKAENEGVKAQGIKIESIDQHDGAQAICESEIG